MCGVIINKTYVTIKFHFFLDEFPLIILHLNGDFKSTNGVLGPGISDGIVPACSMAIAFA